MTLARFAYRCTGVSRPALDANRSPAPCVRPVVPGDDSDRLAVLLLARECADASDPGTAFEPPGLWGELQIRPGRTAHAWLAEGARGAGDPLPGPAGLVSLVVSSAAGRRRFSVAWLLVHPRARRHGLGRLLVGCAVAHARSLGAETVYADTLASWPGAVAFWRAVGFEQLARPRC